jgi:hypothetical protein
MKYEKLFGFAVKFAEVAQEVSPAGEAILRTLLWKAGLWPTAQPNMAELKPEHEISQLISTAIEKADPNNKSSFNIYVLVAPNGTATIKVDPAGQPQAKVAAALIGKAQQMTQAIQTAIKNKMFIDADGGQRQFIPPTNTVKIPLFQLMA